MLCCYPCKAVINLLQPSGKYNRFHALDDKTIIVCVAQEIVKQHLEERIPLASSGSHGTTECKEHFQSASISQIKIGQVDVVSNDMMDTIKVWRIQQLYNQ